MGQTAAAAATLPPSQKLKSLKIAQGEQKKFIVFLIPTKRQYKVVLKEERWATVLIEDQIIDVEPLIGSLKKDRL